MSQNFLKDGLQSTLLNLYDFIEAGTHEYFISFVHIRRIFSKIDEVRESQWPVDKISVPSICSGCMGC
jgi:hypothetical protein